MHLNNEELAQYKYLKEKLDQWQKEDFEKQINNSLYNVLKRVNWHKNIFVKKCDAITIESLISVLDGFEKAEIELNNIKQQLRLIKANTNRVTKILNSTHKLINLTFKKIQYAKR
jgi:molecular chaperone GrpE (heat shock protein)